MKCPERTLAYVHEDRWTVRYAWPSTAEEVCDEIEQCSPPGGVFHKHRVGRRRIYYLWYECDERNMTVNLGERT
jgi:hypothetical protein